MSKGPGVWQRRILSVLDQHQAFFARDLLPLEPTPAQQRSLQRAVCALHDGGKIALARWHGRNPSGGRIVIYRVGILAPPADQIVRLNVAHGQRAQQDEHQYNL
jgi:hypothetical protein